MESKSERLGLLLHDAARAVRKAFECRAEGMGLSSAQWRLLAHVLREGRINQARLADLLEVEPISVSRLVDRMEAAGWVCRLPDPNDRRIHLVAPTPRALDATSSIRAMADQVYAEALRDLSATDRATLLASLSKVIANLSASPNAPTSAAPTRNH